MVDPHLSSALVDYSGFGKTINDLNGSFSLLEFLDLCAILEGLVLHDRLIVVGGKAMPERWSENLKPLLDADVLVIEDLATRNPQTCHQINVRAQSAPSFHRNGIARSSVQDSWYETSRLVNAEAEYKCAPLPLIRQRAIYEKVAFVPQRHTVCDLFGKYQCLATTLQNIRSSSSITIAPYAVVPIPPIPLLVMKNSTNYVEVLPRALDLRDDYRKLRISLKSLHEDLADDTVVPNKKMKAIASWQKTWATLHEYHDSASTIELANNAIGVGDIDDAVDGIGIDSIRLDKLLQTALGASYKALHKWRIRLLHRAARDYLATSDGQLNSEVTRLFGRSVTPRDFQQLDEWMAISQQHAEKAV
jgi:hypothetical protein